MSVVLGILSFYHMYMCNGSGHNVHVTYCFTAVPPRLSCHSEMAVSAGHGYVCCNWYTAERLTQCSDTYMSEQNKICSDINPDDLTSVE